MIHSFFRGTNFGSTSSMKFKDAFNEEYAQLKKKQEEEFNQIYYAAKAKAKELVKENYKKCPWRGTELAKDAFSGHSIFKVSGEKCIRVIMRNDGLYFEGTQGSVISLDEADLNLRGLLQLNDWVIKWSKK